jgi:hypothetical protein
MKKYAEPLAEYCLIHLESALILEASVINDLIKSHASSLGFDLRALSPFIRKAHADLKLPADATFRELGSDPGAIALKLLLSEEPFGRQYTGANNWSLTPNYTFYILAVGNFGMSLTLAGRLLPKDLREDYRTILTSITTRLSEGDDAHDYWDGGQTSKEKQSQQEWSSPLMRKQQIDFIGLIDTGGLNFLEKHDIGDIKHIFVAILHADQVEPSKPDIMPISTGMVLVQRLNPLLQKIIKQAHADISGRIKYLIDAGSYKQIDKLLIRAKDLATLLRSLDLLHSYGVEDSERYEHIYNMGIGRYFEIAIAKSVRYMNMQADQEAISPDLGGRRSNFLPDSYDVLTDKIKQRDPGMLSMVLYFFKLALIGNSSL